VTDRVEGDGLFYIAYTCNSDIPYLSGASLSGNSEGLHFYERNAHQVHFCLNTGLRCSYLGSLESGVEV
jgi:hypothetical protein